MLKKIDAVILCGGLGKRLQSVIGDNQKTFANINGQPFLDILLKFLKKQGIRRVVLLTGFKADDLKNYYQKNLLGLEILFSNEKTPLGTGGALANAKKFIKSDNFFLLNGDSFCAADLKALLKTHIKTSSVATIAVSSVKDNKDYGGVVLDSNNQILAFVEKGMEVKLKNVNAGVYCLSRNIFKIMPKSKKFSMEYDVFPKLINQGFAGFKTKNKFYDIGTPERFEVAQRHFPVFK